MFKNYFISTHFIASSIHVQPGELTFVWCCRHRAHQTSMCSNLTGLHCDKVTSIYLPCSLHWLPVKFTVEFKICVLTNKYPREKQPIYLHSHPFTEIKQRKQSVGPYCQDQRRCKGISLLRPFSLEQTPHYLSIQPPKKTSGNVSKHISLTWPFPLRHQLAQCLIDVTELLH